jgi:hypothetical protein
MHVVLRGGNIGRVPPRLTDAAVKICRAISKFQRGLDPRGGLFGIGWKAMR